ncbi:hypothetical protein COLO4_33887 [Corchorus olitorius]|uniref:Uncharacterized protein n=1 Tax=Corchorus olitorius TaxID=93759 RepID=A0A1R3GQ48_9ROSI|nr:hypothetical protein COLO4_33887 [Corchorus olitorius]
MIPESPVKRIWECIDVHVWEVRWQGELARKTGAVIIGFYNVMLKKNFNAPFDFFVLGLVFDPLLMTCLAGIELDQSHFVLLAL